MTPAEVIAAQAEQIFTLAAENERMRGALEEIARRTMQAPLNRIAHAALGHRESPLTVRLLAELEWERR